LSYGLNRIAAFEDLDTEIEMNRAWEMVREYIKISTKESLDYYEFQKHKPQFEEGCSQLFDQRSELIAAVTRSK
jgi:hypothetical protein